VGEVYADDKRADHIFNIRVYGKNGTMDLSNRSKRSDPRSLSGNGGDGGDTRDRNHNSFDRPTPGPPLADSGMERLNHRCCVSLQSSYLERVLSTDSASTTC